MDVINNKNNYVMESMDTIYHSIQQSKLWNLMDARTNDDDNAMKIMDVGIDMITSNDNNLMMDNMGIDMDMIDDNNDGFSNDNDYFPTASAPMNGVAYNELLLLHYNCMCHHNFNVLPQSRLNICNYIFHHSSCIHWL